MNRATHGKACACGKGSTTFAIRLSKKLTQSVFAAKMPLMTFASTFVQATWASLMDHCRNQAPAELQVGNRERKAPLRLQRLRPRRPRDPLLSQVPVPAPHIFQKRSEKKLGTRSPLSKRSTCIGGACIQRDARRKQA